MTGDEDAISRALHELRFVEHLARELAAHLERARDTAGAAPEDTHELVATAARLHAAALEADHAIASRRRRVGAIVAFAAARVREGDTRWRHDAAVLGELTDPVLAGRLGAPEHAEALTAAVDAWSHGTAAARWDALHALLVQLGMELAASRKAYEADAKLTGATESQPKKI